MDQRSDKTYEVIELGRGKPPLPPDNFANDLPSQPAGRRWPTAVRIGLAFLAGAIVGGFVWDARRDLDQSVATESATLIGQFAGSVTDGEVSSFSLRLLNLGDDPVRVEGLRMAGYEQRSTGSAHATEVPAKGETIATDNIVVDCGRSGPTEPQVFAQVQTVDGGRREAPVRLMGTNPLPEIHNEACLTAPPAGGVVVFFGPVLERGPDFVRTTVTISNYTGRPVRVVGLTPSSPVYAVEGVGLPWEVPPTAYPGNPNPTETGREVVWRVADCAAARTEAVADLGLAPLLDQRAKTDPEPALLGPEGIDLLRLAITSCEKS